MDRMRLQVLVAAMNQNDYSLLDKMNISTDVIVGNQCNRNSVDEFEYKGRKAIYLNFNERGVGLNRNNALMRATGDICLFADDDLEYVEQYDKIIINAFKQIGDADVIVFNLIEEKPWRPVIDKVKRINRFSYTKYGTVRIAIKLESIRKKGIYFNQCFGGGTEHCHGEDTIFLKSCLDKGLKIYAHPAYICRLTEERESTWGNISIEKRILDQAELYKIVSPRCWKLMCLNYARKMSEKFNLPVIDIWKLMIK